MTQTLRHQDRATRKKEFDARRRAAVDARQQMRGLRQHGLRRNDGSLPFIEDAPACRMMRLTPIEQ